MDLLFVNWIDHIWQPNCGITNVPKSSLNNYFIAWTLWNHCNNLIFGNHVGYYNLLFYVHYNKTSNLLLWDDDTGQRHKEWNNIHFNQNWSPPPYGWLKWNIDASMLELASSRMISYVCQESTDKIIKRFGYKFGDCSLFLPEIIGIEEALKTTI